MKPAIKPALTDDEWAGLEEVVLRYAKGHGAPQLLRRAYMACRGCAVPYVAVQNATVGDVPTLVFVVSMRREQWQLYNGHTPVVTVGFYCGDVSSVLIDPYGGHNGPVGAAVLQVRELTSTIGVASQLHNGCSVIPGDKIWRDGEWCEWVRDK